MNIRMKRGMALALTASLLLAGSAQALFGLGKSKPETVSPENGHGPGPGDPHLPGHPLSGAVGGCGP